MSLAQSMNLDSVMAHLTQMSPQQLQQFAAMHKDDPIMLAAASSVKNKMDELQQSRQAQMAGQQPPKVNEQVVQNMAHHQLPEEQGIAQLPAPNMQRMAGGGIVAFADGGYTDEQMMDENNPVTRMAGGGGVLGDIPGYVPGDTSVVPQAGSSENLPFIQRKAREAAEAVRDGTATPQQKALVGWANRFGLGTPELGKQETGSVFTPGATSGFATSSPVTATGEAPVAIGNKAPPPTADKTGAPQPRPPAPTGGIANIPTQDYRAQMAGYMPKETVDPFAAQRSEINDAATNAAQQRANRLREDIAAEGIAGKAQEERLGKREGELGKQKDLNLHMSLIEAGLATMQSHGKGLAGIAEGAGVGMKSYTSGIQRLQAAQEKIDDARDRLDELRRNETRMNNREVRAAEADIENTMLSGKKDALAGMQQAYGMDRQDARTFFETAAKAKEGALDRASRKEIAQIQANATPAQMQLIEKLGGGDFAKGYEIYKQESLLPSMQANYDKMSMDTVNGAAFIAKYPTFATYLRAMNGPSKGDFVDVPAAAAAAAAGNVRPR